MSNGLDVYLGNSQWARRTQISERKTQTIQTHNAVNIGPSSNSASAWIDCNGFDQINVTMLNDASTNSKVSIHWSHDGTNLHGQDFEILPQNSLKERVVRTGVKARYARIVVINTDTASHTISAWVYLIA